ncbi:hypothetical protein [Agrobacterium tumefaciens]|uniref:hypothetical protein n=1 Tax=Agrobacterium tumefaciens TaxID=358 RepID=UPI000DDD3C4F|nr:hypothetical protein [Agrobacterium tumefaciens]MBP2537211.1 hypothetical protein [Agrobacterium tumefaciens]
MLNSYLLKSIVFVMVISIFGNAAYAQSFDDLHGFELDQGLADARKNASARGWELKKSPTFPGEWIVSGTDFSLYTCDDKITAVRVHKVGTLDDFALIVDELQAKHGQPTTNMSTFMAGTIRISTIEASFKGKSSDIKVQLSSSDGKLGLSANFISNLRCSNEAAR